MHGWLKVEWGPYIGDEGMVLSRKVDNGLKMLFRVSVYIWLLLGVPTGTITYWVKGFRHTF